MQTVGMHTCDYPYSRISRFFNVDDSNILQFNILANIERSKQITSIYIPQLIWLWAYWECFNHSVIKCDLKYSKQGTRKHGLKEKLNKRLFGFACTQMHKKKEWNKRGRSKPTNGNMSAFKRNSRRKRPFISAKSMWLLSFGVVYTSRGWVEFSPFPSSLILMDTTMHAGPDLETEYWGVLILFNLPLLFIGTLFLTLNCNNYFFFFILIINLIQYFLNCVQFRINTSNLSCFSAYDQLIVWIIKP